VREEVCFKSNIPLVQVMRNETRLVANTMLQVVMKDVGNRHFIEYNVFHSGDGGSRVHASEWSSCRVLRWVGSRRTCSSGGCPLASHSFNGEVTSNNTQMWLELELD
jgi:hypothetical protein